MRSTVDPWEVAAHIFCAFMSGTILFFVLIVAMAGVGFLLESATKLIKRLWRVHCESLTI